MNQGRLLWKSRRKRVQMTRWVCKKCPSTAVSSRQGIPFHQCRGMHGLSVPLVTEDADCVVELSEREDYVGSEQVQLAPGNGRPYAAVITRRGDGSNDTAVYAPAATARRS